MLQGMSVALTRTVEQAYAGAVPGGNFAHGTGSHQSQESPDQISEEELRQYFLYLKIEKQVSCSTSTVALYGIKFFFVRILQRR